MARSGSGIHARDVLDGSAWVQFCERLKALAPELTRPDVPGGELDRAEGLRHLTRLLSYALDVAIELSDSERPIFHPHPGLSYKWGGDNPDNLYQHAAIEGDKTYRIRGRRGSELDFILQANSCGPQEAPGAGRRRGKPGLAFSELSAKDLEIAVDGSFEVIASPERHPGNWLPLHPDVGWINIRQYFADWDRERPAEFLIERVGMEGTSPPPLTAERMADKLESALAWVEHGMPYWTDWLQQEILRHPVNSAGPLGAVAVSDGVRMISYGAGHFALEPGQALIFDCEVPRARYWQVGLLNSPWFETLDYVDHQSCLNSAQIRADADGRFRLVISPEDPGVPNWLDSAGHRHGLIQYRWIWYETEPKPTCRVVPLGRLRSELPGDTPVVAPEQRRRRIARRREHVLRRFHLC